MLPSWPFDPFDPARKGGVEGRMPSRPGLAKLEADAHFEVETSTPPLFQNVVGPHHIKSERFLNIAGRSPDLFGGCRMQ